MKSKGQAALEFLMTYGWAIMLVIVVVGALYATGMLKPCRWVGVQVNFPQTPVGVLHIATNSSLMVIEISNNNPKTINITSVSAKISAEGELFTGDVAFEGLEPPFELETGKKVKAYINFGRSLASGTCVDVELTVDYIIEGVTGSRTGKISHSV